MTEFTDPHDALAIVARTEEKLATRMRWPLWRHMAYGLLLAICVLIWVLPSTVSAGAMILCLVGVFLLIRSDRRRHGMFVSGWSSPAARPATIASLLMFLAGFAAIVVAGEGLRQWTPLAVPVALAVFAGGTLCSIWWERLNLRDLERERRA